MANKFKKAIKENTSVIDMMINTYTVAHKSIETMKGQVKRQDKMWAKELMLITMACLKG